MMIGETLHKCVDGILVEIAYRLIYLEDLRIRLYRVSIDRERNHHLDVIRSTEFRQGPYLFGIKWTEDDVAIVGILLQQCLTNISINRYIPCEYVSGNTLLFQRITSHQDTTIEFYHSPTVSIYVM